MSLDDMSIEELKQLREVVSALIDYSSAGIIRNNFVEAFYRCTYSGRLHGNYRLFGAKSFRLTSNNPNMLNSPSSGSIYAKHVKRCFEAEWDHIFYTVDYGALEERIIANLSRDKNKCNIFLKGLDSHCLNSYNYWKDKVEAILPREDNESTEEYVVRYKKAVDDGNKALKQIRSDSKPASFALNYGAMAKKLSSIIKCNLDEAEQLHYKFHNELYPQINEMLQRVYSVATKTGRVHLGLGCYLHSNNPDKDIRSLFNACSQFWSILTLLSINKLRQAIEKAKLEDKVEIVSTIYDSIYLHVLDDNWTIKWVNDHLIPIMLKPPFEDMIVENEATGAIGYNWYDIVEIPNGATIKEIEDARKRAKELYQKND